ncbi:hypothetical protein DFP72DRAFT_1050688 [Ephemerocybe angulata]|uniref:Uncharacterized protein n=1 Tax=Ephemerocybe angulata TaxID=980116 RepID=A0A8H6HHZ2_9AGAR|nr:hypothetical protein DFP72DRAFT_1050688 [Tulosesus angulatus]
MNSLQSYGLYDVEATQSPSPKAPSAEEKRDFIRVILQYEGGSDHVIMRRPKATTEYHTFTQQLRQVYFLGHFPDTFNVRLYTTELDECRGIEVRVPEELWTHFSPSVNTWIAKPVPTQYEPDRSKMDTREQHVLSDQTREEVLGKEGRHGDSQVEARMKNGGGGIARIGNPNGTARESAAETSATPVIDPQVSLEEHSQECHAGTERITTLKQTSPTLNPNPPMGNTPPLRTPFSTRTIYMILALLGALVALHVLANLLPLE